MFEIMCLIVFVYAFGWILNDRRWYWYNNKSPMKKGPRRKDSGSYWYR